MSTIKGTEHPLHKVLSSDFEFHIPDYQRPYSWTREQASELFDDIWGFRQTQGTDEKYFLGSIVLVKSDDDPSSDVVDGQQRLTTLTVLLSAIGDYLIADPNWMGEYDIFVREPGSRARRLDPKPRLFLRERDRQFFADHVQTPGNFQALLQLDVENLPEPQGNVVMNARHFAEKLDGKTPDQVGEFGQFLVNNCYLVLVSTDSFKSAYRIFSVLNDRGLDLEPSDILKARIIGEIPQADRPTYTEVWEDLEEQAGRRAFNDLISHIRMIFRKEKARRSQLEEFMDHVYSKTPSAVALIDDVLVPYAEAFEIVREANYRSNADADSVNRLLHWLQRINNVDWIPVAMQLIRMYGDDTAYLIRLLTILERLAASMFIRGVYVTPRIERYGKVLTALEQEEDLEAESSPLNLSGDEINHTVANLEGPVYHYSAKLRSYIMLRLDAFLAGTGAVYQHSVTTIEHVLPQTVATGSEWNELWTLEDRDHWTNRIGNLVLLSRAKNSEAQNYDFGEKKRRYFRSKSGVSPYASSTEVLGYDQWTVDEVKMRQDKLLGVFHDGWQLG